jgi:hypothetical protein
MIFHALTTSKEISTLVSEKHFNPRQKFEVLHGRCRAQNQSTARLVLSTILSAHENIWALCERA